MSIDLHVHTTASDGTLSPEAVIAKAIARGLTAVGIADHDTMAGLAPAATAAQGRIHFIPGVEISTHTHNAELHILGYFVDPTCDSLAVELHHIREERVTRIHRTVERLQKLAIGITSQDVFGAGTSEADGLVETAVGRPHVAAALVRLGAATSPADAFDRYLRRGRPAYVDRYRATPEQAIQLIREAGGLASLAHPGLMHRDSLVPTLVEMGLGALEAYHSAHTPSDVRRYLGLAERLGLLVTGGTDSHGPGGTTPVEIGALDIPDVYGERLLQWAQDRA